MDAASSPGSFSTLLGWLGVALTGSDAASDVLFGSLQKTAAEQAGISPVLLGAERKQLKD
jgi:lactate permease